MSSGGWPASHEVILRDVHADLDVTSVTLGACEEEGPIVPTWLFREEVADANTSCVVHLWDDQLLGVSDWSSRGCCESPGTPAHVIRRAFFF